MIHIMENDWIIDGIGEAEINTKILWSYIKYSKIQPKSLNLDDVAYKPLDNIDIHGYRYILADINYPMIVVENMPNPDNKRYRMIDGRHRLLKQLNSGLKDFNFYILQYDDVKPHIYKT